MLYRLFERFPVSSSPFLLSEDLFSTVATCSTKCGELTLRSPARHESWGDVEAQDQSVEEGWVREGIGEGVSHGGGCSEIRAGKAYGGG